MTEKQDMGVVTQAGELSELMEALESVDIEEGCTIFNHTPEEIGLMVMENRKALLTCLASQADQGECPVQFATVRDGGDEWHIECRFKDGQKFAAVTVDKDQEALADWIAKALTHPQPSQKGEGDE